MRAPLIPAELDKKSFDDLITEQAAAATTKGITGDQLENSCYQECSAILRYWIGEIVADVLAIHTLGPAYFFSFLQFFANKPIGDLPDSEHPVPSYRANLLLGELKELGYFAADLPFSKRLAALRPVAAASATKVASSYPSHINVVHRTIESNRVKILKELRRFCEPFSYWAKRYKADVGELARRLQDGLLPMNPYQKGANPLPVSPIAVLNAGWQLHETAIDPFLSLFDPSLERPDKLQNLNRLVFKSMEANELVRRYFE